MVDVFLCIFALCFLIILHEAGHMVVAKWCGMRVDRFSMFFGPAIFKFRRGETTYQIGTIPLGGFVQIAGLNPHDDTIAADDPRSYPNRPVWQRLATIFAGPGANYLIAAIMFAALFAVWGVPLESNTPFVAELLPGRPAVAAGLQVDDDIVEVDGKPVNNIREMIAAIDGSQPGCKAPEACRAVQLKVRRQKTPMAFQVRPVRDEGRWIIGITPDERPVFVKVSPGKAVVAGLTYPYEYSVGHLKALGFFMSRWIKRGVAPPVSGPVGIVKQMKKHVARGFHEGAMTIAVISVLLGLFNLLPVPALDGARLMFLAAEGLSRRKVNQRMEGYVHLVGLVLLLCLVLYITFRPGGDVFGGN
jgi:regulator of sigma E protease